MTKNYDPQYSTKVAFNTPIMEAMLGKRDIELVKHWFEHGEPNKNLAAAALNKMLLMQWIEALELLFNSEWLTKKGFLSKAWLLASSSYGHYYKDPLANTETEKWLINKTYNEKFLSANEINNLHLNILDKTRSDYYWDMFFTPNIKLKGKTADDIFGTVKYFAYYDKTEQGHKSKECLDNVIKMKQRLIDVITHKNGFVTSIHDILEILIEHKDNDIFWLILENKFILEQKEMFLLATILSIHFNVIGRRFDKMPEEEIDAAIEKLAACFAKAGLKESVTFTKDDCIKKYSRFFFSGYISIINIRHLDYYRRYAVSPSASHLEEAPTHHNHPKTADITFYTGDAIFTKPSVRGHEIEYKQQKTKDLEASRKKYKQYLNNIEV